MKNERLRWACRRGMLELDMLLVPFFDQHFESLSTEQKKTFEELLSEQDPDLFSWFIGLSIPENNAMKAMVKIIKDAKLNEYTT